ncbi:hypothetical protein HBI56_025900 [Parastagonospora nodorum]|nr:hypothetical protein HBH56_013560 [Parastagonospora nodorum]KAH4100676.1 hypothetical protein HBH46_149380 [Parastagonospora nodorum]KAH4134530.1 hypothetical protein HBH45_162250 [Parastagonospora nodorum]KAH4200503.1 hypothetical protein HBI95_170500 [Parastagonospora nodorum]KAH4236210.1 hypothetical protein HBI05_134140 [Parastagonospora nodorum]
MRTASMRCARSSKNFTQLIGPTLVLNKQKSGNDVQPHSPKLKKMSYYLTRPPPITTSPQAASNTRVEPSPIS